MAKATRLISPLRISPDPVATCKGCERPIDPRATPNLNVILTGNAALDSQAGALELSPVFDLYHAPCWLTAAKMNKAIEDA